MSLQKETVASIAILCKHFKLSDEILFSCLDTFARYSKILFTQLRNIPTEYNGKTVSSISRVTIWPKILIILLLCTKCIEGGRSRSYINYRRILEFLQRFNTTLTIDELKLLECQVFHSLEFKVTVFMFFNLDLLLYIFQSKIYVVGSR